MATLDPEDPPIEGTAPRVASSVRRRAEGPQLERYHDHFTLHTQSTIVRFRSKTNAARVYDNHGSQLVLEESLDPDTKVGRFAVQLGPKASRVPGNLLYLV
jgi:predicted transcriptional regulator